MKDGFLSSAVSEPTLIPQKRGILGWTLEVGKQQASFLSYPLLDLRHSKQGPNSSPAPGLSRNGLSPPPPCPGSLVSPSLQQLFRRHFQSPWFPSEAQKLVLRKTLFSWLCKDSWDFLDFLGSSDFSVSLLPSKFGLKFQPFVIQFLGQQLCKPGLFFVAGARAEERRGSRQPFY